MLIMVEGTAIMVDTQGNELVKVSKNEAFNSKRVICEKLTP